MIDISKVVEPSYEQWEAIIRGMRNPMNSWDKSDSKTTLLYSNSIGELGFRIGESDHDLMMKLRNNGSPSHRKFMRMIPVYLDINAPLYWWKEFDTYKVGTVANSCSTMHKIATKEFEMDDFSHEHLFDKKVNPFEIFSEDLEPTGIIFSSDTALSMVCNVLNYYRERFLETHEKEYWWQMIQLLPSSYNQKRTVFLNYEVLANIYHDRKDHKLDEWRKFCEWIESLSYSELITGGDNNG